MDDTLARTGRWCDGRKLSDAEYEAELKLAKPAVPEDRCLGEVTDAAGLRIPVEEAKEARRVMAPTLNAVWENPWGGWIEDLTMFGCVESHPGPIDVAQATLVTAGSMLLNEIWKLAEVSGSTTSSVIEQTCLSAVVITEEAGKQTWQAIQH